MKVGAGWGLWVNSVALLPSQGRQNKFTFVRVAGFSSVTERLIFMYQQVSFNILIKQLLIISDERSYKTKERSQI